MQRDNAADFQKAPVRASLVWLISVMLTTVPLAFVLHWMVGRSSSERDYDLGKKRGILRTLEEYEQAEKEALKSMVEGVRNGEDSTDR